MHHSKKLAKARAGELSRRDIMDQYNVTRDLFPGEKLHVLLDLQQNGFDIALNNCVPRRNQQYTAMVHELHAAGPEALNAAIYDLHWERHKTHIRHQRRRGIMDQYHDKSYLLAVLRQNGLDAALECCVLPINQQQCALVYEMEKAGPEKLQTAIAALRLQMK